MRKIYAYKNIWLWIFHIQYNNYKYFDIVISNQSGAFLLGLLTAFGDCQPENGNAILNWHLVRTLWH